jgi:hypothetical protein
MLLERYARLLLILHAVGAAVLCGAIVHTLLSVLRRLRGRPPWPRERALATTASLAYLVTFGLGLLVYPTYRVRVRAEYFDSPRLAQAEAQARATLHAELRRTPRVVPIPPRSLAGAARLFDIKEHWIALVLPIAVGLLVLGRRAGRSPERRVVALYAGLCATLGAASFAAALIGLVTAAHRSVGAPG